MALDPSIALGVRPLEVPNQLAQYAQMAQVEGAQQQNVLARYQLGAAQRAENVQNAMSNAYSQSLDPKTGQIDYNKLIGRLAAGGAGSQIPGVEKIRREIDTAALTQDKLRTELVTSKTAQFRDRLNNVNSPEAAAQWTIAMYSDPHLKNTISSVPLEAALAEIPNTPEEFNVWKNQNALGMAEFIKQNKPTVTAQNTGSNARLLASPGLGGPATQVPGSSAPITMSEYQIASNKIAKDRLIFDQSKFAWEKANPGFELKEAQDGSIVGVNTRTLQAFPVTVGGAAPAAAPAMPGGGVPGARLPAPGAGPAAPGMAPPAAGAPGVPLMGKGTALTESQGNATAYGLRMKEANSILEDLAKKGTLRGANIEATSFIGESLGKVLPSFLGGTSAAQQQVNQAKSNFITAVLRKESGAVISDSEFEREDRKYFPQVNDNDAVIKQKANARKLAIKAMEIQAGPGAKNIQKYQPSSGIPGASASDPLGLGIGD